MNLVELRIDGQDQRAWASLASGTCKGTEGGTSAPEEFLQGLLKGLAQVSEIMAITLKELHPNHMARGIPRCNQHFQLLGNVALQWAALSNPKPLHLRNVQAGGNHPPLTREFGRVCQGDGTGGLSR
jgi:hypothetical protein